MAAVRFNMFKLFNILDYKHLVIGQVKAVDQFNAWIQAMTTHNHYYNVYVVEIR